MAEKLIAEWFWIDRWDGSSAPALPIEQRGLYREMLTRAWRLGGSLPNDHAAIQRLCRVTVKEWKRCWPGVSRYWRLDGDRLVNDTQLEIMAEARSRQEAAETRAKHAASRRWSNAQALPKHSPPASIGQALPEQSPPSPSPFSPDRSDRSADRRQPANPFIDGREDEYAREAMRLSAQIGHLRDEDPAEVFRNGAHYEGARGSKVNPASLSADRLLNTVLDLRETLKAELSKRGLTRAQLEQQMASGKPA